MSENNHISKKDLLAFQQDRLDQMETVRVLEHICSCNYCANQLADLMSEEILIAPRDLKENILKATRRPEVHLAVKAKETSKRMQLFIYSLKVGTATVGALLLLLLTMNFTDITTTQKNHIGIDTIAEDKTSLTDTIKNNMNKISNSILDFSNNIMKTEVTDNDQKEK